MREVKFRAKTKNGSPWQYGYYVKQEKVLIPVGENKNKDSHYIFHTGSADWNMPRQLVMVEIDPETLGELTGLNDKNGVEIYDGDIIKSGGIDQGVVKWNEDELTYELNRGVFSSQEGWQPMPLSIPVDLKVIGNVHDNPELLK
jgi:uncharacterized phage protein (TIGR01671 family)